MKLHDDGDFTGLNWVKPALDATLLQAREALETYVEHPGQIEPMRECTAHLHQVQGTLRMVELYGAAMVVENMERLAEALLADTVKQRDESYSVLMRGMVQLPDYLERLQSGHKDIPIVLLPLLNDLRACRGENLLSESALFAPDLDVALPASADGSAQPLAAGDLRTQALRLRLAFQAALLKWFRDEGTSEHLRRLLDVLDRLRAISYAPEARRLWWVAAGVIESVENGGLEASVAIKLLLGRIDREIHRLAMLGEVAFAAASSRELIKNLLYYCAHSSGLGARGNAVRSAYRLDTLLPSASELQHAQGSMAGRNKNLLGTVSAAIKDDLLRVKEALDIFLRSGQSDASELAGQLDVLDRVADTLGMLGLGVPRRVVTEQHGVIEEMIEQRRPVDEDGLLDVAGALLYVEASLDDHIEQLGAGSDNEEAEAEQLNLPKAEARQVVDALMREAAINIQQAKHDVIAFIESPWDHERVVQIPRLLEEIAGALRMLGLDDAAQLMTAIVRFVEIELIAQRRVPTAEQMDKLADALTAIEYYLEATREQRRNREKILDVARESMQALGYWPLPPARESMATDTPTAFVPVKAAPDAQQEKAAELDLQSVADLAYGNFDDLPVPPGDMSAPSLTAAEPVDDEYAQTAALDSAAYLPSIDLLPGHDLHDLIVGEASTPEPVGQDLDGLRLAETGTDDIEWIEIEEEIEEEVPVDEPQAAGFQGAAGEEIDDDIREVFIEEVDDEIASLRRQVPLWKGDVENLDELKTIRRSFHTLKGSGRLVGALALGEFSWKVEGLLNRVLDGSVAASPAVVALVDHAIDALPGLLGALRGETVSSANLAGIMETADRLAAGEEVWLPEYAVGTRTVRRTVRRRIPAAQRELPAIRGDIQNAGSLVNEAGADEAAELVAGPLPNVDPVLFDILQTEVAAHLGVIESYIARSAVASVPASEELLRAAHTLNGAIAMVDIPVIGRVLAPLESYIKRLRGEQAAPGPDGIAVLEETVALTRDVMQRLEMRNRDMPDSTTLAERVIALNERLPEPAASWPLYSELVSEPDADQHVEMVSEAEAIDHAPEADQPVEAISETDAIEYATESEAEQRFETTVETATDEADAQSLSMPESASEQADQADSIESWMQEAHADAEAKEAVSASALRASVPEDLAASLTAFDMPSAEADGTRYEVMVPDNTSETFLGSEPWIEPATLEDSVNEALDLVETARADETPPPMHEESVAFADEEIVLADAAPDVTHALTLDDDISHLIDSTPLQASESGEDAGVFAPSDAPTPSGAVSAHEPLAGPEAAPIAEDAQPDGVLELIDTDDELLDIFVQEGADILDHSDSLVASLREAPHERLHVVGLQRDLHTLKGGARMAGLAPIGDLSHAMESLVDAISDGRLAIDRVSVESLERGFDRLHVLVQRVAQRRAIAMPTHAIARFESLVSGEVVHADDGATAATSTAAAATPTTPLAASATMLDKAASDGVVQPPAARPKPRHLTAMDQEETPHAPQEMIRVRSDLLDSLVNYAGEVSIYRSRLEQQISTFRFNLVEFDQTVSRLRDQLRKLEIETEAQIIARFQREQQDTGLGAFDPLELDRFSQLQQLSRALGESVSDLVSIQGLLDDQTRQSETLLLQQQRVSSDLQEGLMRTRMVPFDSLVPNLRRTLRQAAQEVGKRAQLKVEGAHGEMDRNLLERMKAPFEHMLRNALAHGIETPDDRVAAGKPAEGTVNIAVSRESTEVVLRVTDDGRGMDRDAIRRQAIERGLLAEGASLSDRDLYAFVLETGFSTARELTQLSGRGVGMDVVHTEIKQLGGSLVIDSTPGQGAGFTIRLPFTLAVTQAILVKLGESSYAIPMSSVQGVARIASDDLERRFALGNPKHSYAGEEFNIYDLAQLLGVTRARVSDDTQVPLLMVRSGDQRAAVRIDGVVGSREIVVKSVGPQISSVPGIFGATIMGDGAVVIILDLAPMVRRIAALRARIDAGSIEDVPSYMAAEPTHEPQARQKPLVMVVDDSITMRKVTTRVLERADFDVVTAKDGLDALEKLQENVPDLMLLDIEMPRMDGYELATYMRNDSRLRQVPIIMITSRTGEKHRQRALEIGVEHYLGKPYQEDDLLKHVHEVLGRERV